MTQDDAFTLLTSGYNVFLTGSPGTGKTYLLNNYINYLKEHDVAKAVTASTGIAATHLNGTTIHSWSGIKINETLSSRTLSKICGDSRIVRNYLNTKVLIIDEISMLHDFQFEMIDQIARKIRDNDQPFGGLQLIVSGDFFQLPPVAGQLSKKKTSNFVYMSPLWELCQFKIANLTEQYRTYCDKLFSVLNNIRTGNNINDMKIELIEKVENDCLTLTDEDLEGYTRIYTKNVDVDFINNEYLNKLPGVPRTFRMQTDGNHKICETLKKGCLAPDILRLKVDALVMFVANIPDLGCMNGTQGRIIAFTKDNIPLVELKDGRKVRVKYHEWAHSDLQDGRSIGGCITQIPLRLAWAITAHKSQGMTIDLPIIDLSEAFVEGQGYVALSRATSFDKLKLIGLNDKALRVSHAAQEFYANIA